MIKWSYKRDILLVFTKSVYLTFWPDKMGSLWWEWPYKMGSLLWEWPYKMGSLLWEWPDKMGSLWWEWPYKMGSLWWEWPYKMGSLWWKWPYKRDTSVNANFTSIPIGDFLLRENFSNSIHSPVSANAWIFIHQYLKHSDMKCEWVISLRPFHKIRKR